MNRYALIDGLRGLGALAIAAYHIFRYGDLPVAAAPVLPDFLKTCLANGWMAVQWFFVIGGFAAVLATRNWKSTITETMIHIIKRVLRLGAVYWVALAVTALLTILAIDSWNDRSLNDAKPTPHQFIAHLFFLQDILGFDCLNTGVWFIAIALQLDVVFVGLLTLSFAVSQVLQRRQVRSADAVSLALCYLPLTVWSLFWSLKDPATDVWFHHFFCMFMLGAVMGWVVLGRLTSTWFWAYCGLVGVQLVNHYTSELLIALVAALSIYTCWRLGKLQTWLNAPVLQSLGTLSYSLFVIHYPVSWTVGKIGYHLTGDNAVAACGWLLVSLAASLAAAWLLYNFVERPVLQRTRNLTVPTWLAGRFNVYEARASA